jgi:hypothetical protein
MHWPFPFRDPLHALHYKLNLPTPVLHGSYQAIKNDILELRWLHGYKLVDNSLPHFWGELQNGQHGVRRDLARLEMRMQQLQQPGFRLLDRVLISLVIPLNDT